jgi:hypothetical protein
MLGSIINHESLLPAAVYFIDTGDAVALTQSNQVSVWGSLLPAALWAIGCAAIQISK